MVSIELFTFTYSDCNRLVIDIVGSTLALDVGSSPSFDADIFVLSDDYTIR